MHGIFVGEKGREGRGREEKGVRGCLLFSFSIFLDMNKDRYNNQCIDEVVYIPPCVYT